MPSYFRPSQIDLLTHTKNRFHNSTHSCNIGLSEIRQYDLLLASWAITRDIEYCHTSSLGWEIKYFSFR